MKGNDFMNNEFTIRALNTKDIFSLVKIISKFGISEIRKCISTLDFRNISKGTDKYRATGIAVAMEIFSVAVDRLPECENEIYKFLGSMSDRTAEEIANQSPVTTVRMIKAVIKKDDFGDFFTEVSELLTATKTE